MADNQVVSELIIRNGQANRTEVDEFGRHFQKAAKAASDGFKIIDTSAAQSSERVKASYDRIIAGLDPLTAATHRIEQEYARSLRGIENARRRDLISDQQYTADKQRLADKRIADINRERAAMAGNDNSRNTRAAGLNAAFQFQDISMMAIAGQNPLMTAVQQGTQLAGIMQQVQASGGNAFKTLAAGAASMLNWTTLVAVTLTAVVTTAIQWGIEMVTAGDKAKRTMEEQAEALDAVVEKHGEILTSLREISELRKEEEDRAKVATVTAEQQAAIYEKNADKLQEIRLKVASQAQGIVATDEGIGINKALKDLTTNFGELDATGQDVQFVIEALRKAFGDTNTVVNEQVVQLLLLKAALDAASGASRKLADEQTYLELQGAGYPFANRRQGAFGLVMPDEMAPPGSGQDARTELTDEQLADQRLFPQRLSHTERLRRQTLKRLSPDVFGSDIPIPRAAENPGESLDDARVESEKNIREEREKLTKATLQLAEAERKRAQQAADFVANQEGKLRATQLELDTVGMEEDARTRLLAQLKAEEELRKTNVTLTEDQANRYREAAAATAEAEIKLKNLNEAQKDVNEQQEFFSGLMMDGLDSLITGGEKLEDVFKRIALAIADAVLQAALLGKGPLASFFGWEPKEGYSVGGLFGDFFGNRNKAGPSAGEVQAAGVLAGSGWGGMRDLGPLVGGAVGGASGSGGGVQAMAWNFFKSKGLPDFQVAAILGHMQAESGFNPGIRGDSGNALGLFQWNDRRHSMIGSVGEGWANNPMGQLQFAWSEMMGPESRAFNNLRTSTNLRGATGAFMGYERPRGFTWANPEGGDNFSGRLAGAEQMLQKFGGTMQQATQNTATMAQAAGGATNNLGGFGNAVAQAATSLGGSGGGGGGAGGGIFSGLFNLFTGGGGFTGTTSLATGWSTRAALGGAFQNGNVIPFARGGIVTRPTLFPMANGAGLMGEAGPEAIMPLRRGPGGKLGVAVSGGGGGVVIHNYANADVKVRESNDNSGRYEIIMEERVASRISQRGTPLNRSVREATSNRLKKM